ELLHVDVGTAERCTGLRSAPLPGVGQVLRPPDHPHAASAAARDRLDHRGAAGGKRRQERAGLFQRRRRRRAGGDRNVVPTRERPRLELVSEELQHLGPWTDEPDAVVYAAPCERGTLAEESPSRMDGVAARVARDRDQLLGIEVRRGTRAAEWPR